MSEIQIIESPEVIGDSRIGIVASRYNGAVVERLLGACLETLQDNGIREKSISLVRVPGAFELPVAAKRLASAGGVDAIIALGAVIRGGTAHFDYVAGECASGLSRVALDHAIPVIFGVLTVDNEQQALERSGEGEQNKGREAANAALEMIGVLAKLEK